MKQSELIQLITTPQNANFEDVSKLQSLKNEFPFFQSAHLLLSLVSKKHDSSLFQQTLKNTAISIPNRSRLNSLLNNPEFFKKTQVSELKHNITKIEEVKKKTSEIDHLKAIEVESEKRANLTEEELNQQVEQEVEKQIIAALVEKQILGISNATAQAKKETLKAGSFNDWLKVLKKEEFEDNKVLTKETTELVEKQNNPNINRKLEQKAIIDKIIEVNPRSLKAKSENDEEGKKFYTPDDKAKESLFENEELVTETLAKIYALSGNIAKAKRAYEILSLKFPQKSAYFASLIENLKKGNL